MGPPAEIERYKRVFHVGEPAGPQPVLGVTDMITSISTATWAKASGPGRWETTRRCSTSSPRPTSPAAFTRATRPSCSAPPRWRSAKGVAIGAHPGFNDLWGFGRRVIRGDTLDEIERMVAYQIGAMQACAALAGHAVTYVKAHGALNNMANEEDDFALAHRPRHQGRRSPRSSMSCMPGLPMERRRRQARRSRWRASSSPTAPMTITAT